MAGGTGRDPQARRDGQRPPGLFHLCSCRGSRRKRRGSKRGVGEVSRPQQDPHSPPVSSPHPAGRRWVLGTVTRVGDQMPPAKRCLPSARVCVSTRVPMCASVHMYVYVCPCACVHVGPRGRGLLLGSQGMEGRCPVVRNRGDGGLPPSCTASPLSLWSSPLPGWVLRPDTRPTSSRHQVDPWNHRPPLCPGCRPAREARCPRSGFPRGPVWVCCWGAGVSLAGPVHGPLLAWRPGQRSDH